MLSDIGARDLIAECQPGHRYRGQGCRGVESEAESEDDGFEVIEAESEASMENTRRIDRGVRLKACMGLMMGPAVEVGSMKVGDQIEVLASREQFYTNQRL